MNYPFLYQKLGQLDVQELNTSLQLSDDNIVVWDDWNLREAKSTLVSDFIRIKIPHLNIFNNQIYVSQGISSNFHIDRFHIHHLLHRVLIPMQDTFKYQWIVNDKIIQYQPVCGEVLLFNNMVPHRFVSEQKVLRSVVYFDLCDPLTENMASQFTGNYSEENGLLTEKYKNL